MDKKILHQNFSGFIFATSVFASKFLHYNCLCHKYLYIILGSKETTHAEINVQDFVTQKMLMLNFLMQKNAC